jgi:RNA polymerase sigma factor (sigma-70 family)
MARIPAPAPVRLGDPDRQALAAALARTKEKGLAFARTLPLLEADVARLGARHLAGLGLEPTPERVANYVARAALEDLVLACACEAGDVGSWDTLDQLYRDRLVGFGIRRGISGADADGIVSDVFGDLYAPPPSGGARTLLGTFDASGSLFGWLSIVVLRRIAGAARSRRGQSLDALEEAADVETTPRPGIPSPPPPPLVLVEAESTARFAAAFAEAFERLTGQERLALVAKHRDGLTQRRIGDLLGVGEARVSRIVSAGVATLAAALYGAGFPPDSTDGSDLAALAAAVGSHLARSGPVGRPSGAGTAGDAPAGGAPGTSVPGSVRHP